MEQERNTQHVTRPDAVYPVICIQGGGGNIAERKRKWLERRYLFYSQRFGCAWSSL